MSNVVVLIKLSGKKSPRSCFHFKARPLLFNVGQKMACINSWD